MSQWQGIESAPRDGTQFLAFFDHKRADGHRWMTGGTIAEVWFGVAWDNEPNPLLGLLSDGCAVDADVLGQPTHWMPLPPPPGDAG